jgi:hypothetical protein
VNLEVDHDCILPRTVLDRVISQASDLLVAPRKFAESHRSIMRYRPSVAKCG